MAQRFAPCLFWSCTSKMIVLTIVATKLWIFNFHKSHQNSCVLMPNDKPKTSQKPAEPLR